MKKLDRLLTDDTAIMAQLLGCSEVQAYRVKRAVKNGTYAARLLEQIRALYDNYGLTPNDVIKYRDDN